MSPCVRAAVSRCRSRTGRPVKRCSQKCRRAAYEERRAPRRGAVAIEVVADVKYVEHDLD